MAGNDVTKWNIEDVAAFVKSLPGCDEHAKTFIEEVSTLNTVFIAHYIKRKL